MRFPTIRRAGRAVVSAVIAGLAGAAPAAADGLPLSDAASSWTPSFGFLAEPGAAAPPSAVAPAPPRAPAASPAPVCASALADVCLTSVAAAMDPAAPAADRPAGLVTPASALDLDASLDGPAAGPVLAAVTPPAGATVLKASTDANGGGGAPDPVRHEVPRDEIELWVPALSFFGGALIQDADSALASRPLYDPDALNVPTQLELCAPNDPLDCIRPSASGSDRQVTPFVAASLELMSPGLQELPGRPRAFIHADAAVSFSRTRNIAREGVPDASAVAPPPGSGEYNPPQIIAGQGSQTSSYVKSLILGGGLGIAFTADVGERRLRIKPSVEYLREKIRVEGEVIRVVASEEDPDAPIQVTGPACKGRDLEFCRVINLTGSGEKAFHGVGPGLELEMDAGRAGPVILSVYTAGAAYRMLGDLDIEFSETQLADPGEPDSAETANWSYEKDRWSYRAGVGLRFRFAPED